MDDSATEKTRLQLGTCILVKFQLIKYAENISCGHIRVSIYWHVSHQLEIQKHTATYRFNGVEKFVADPQRRCVSIETFFRDFTGAIRIWLPGLKTGTPKWKNPFVWHAQSLRQTTIQSLRRRRRVCQTLRNDSAKIDMAPPRRVLSFSTPGMLRI